MHAEAVRLLCDALASPHCALKELNVLLCRAYCDKVIKLSDTLQARRCSSRADPRAAPTRNA